MHFFFCGRYEIDLVQVKFKDYITLIGVLSHRFLPHPKVNKKCYSLNSLVFVFTAMPMTVIEFEKKNLHFSPLF